MNRALCLSAAVVLSLGSSVFAAPPSPGSADEPGPVRVQQYKAAVKTFRLELSYAGDEDKPFYRLVLSVQPVDYDRSNPFYRLAQIKTKEAVRLIDYLAADGFFERAIDRNRVRQFAAPAVPNYTLTVSNAGTRLTEDLGWGLPMLRRLDGLRKVLEGDAAQQVDVLLGRLSGLRSVWEKEAGEPVVLNGMSLRVTMERTTIAPGREMVVAVTLKNVSEADILCFRTNGDDMRFVDAASGAVWVTQASLYPPPPASPPSLVTMKPGETWSHEIRFGPKSRFAHPGEKPADARVGLPPGRYRLEYSTTFVDHYPEWKKNAYSGRLKAPPIAFEIGNR